MSFRKYNEPLGIDNDDYWFRLAADEAARTKVTKYLELPTIDRLKDLTVDEVFSVYNLDLYSQEKLDELLYEHIEDIFKAIINYDHREQMIDLFYVEKFNKSITKLISENSMRFELYTPMLNSIIANYNGANATIKYNFQSILNWLNGNIISKLSDMKLSVDIISGLIKARYSGVIFCTRADTGITQVVHVEDQYNYEEIKNVRELNNFILMNCEDITPYFIMDIYHILFTHMSELFNGVMHDTYPMSKNIDKDKSVQMYNCVSTAMLAYLDMQTIDVISGVLQRYSIDHINYYYDIPVRFDICELSRLSGYVRIHQVCNNLMSNGFVFP